MESKKEKAKNILQRMYHLRVKVDRKGTPIVNVSSIFGAACLLFAPHMTLVGVVASLILGYQIHFENEEDDAEIQEQIRVAAQNMKNGVVNAAKSIQQEIDRRTAGKPEEAQTKPAPAEAAEPAVSNEELLKELKEKAGETVQSNPAATTFHSAYAASAGSVPVLRVEPETAETEAPSAPKAQGGAE